MIVAITSENSYTDYYYKKPREFKMTTTGKIIKVKRNFLYNEVFTVSSFRIYPYTRIYRCSLFDAPVVSSDSLYFNLIH